MDDSIIIIIFFNNKNMIAQRVLYSHINIVIISNLAVCCKMSEINTIFVFNFFAKAEDQLLRN